MFIVNPSVDKTTPHTSHHAGWKIINRLTKYKAILYVSWTSYNLSEKNRSQCEELHDHRTCPVSMCKLYHLQTWGHPGPCCPSPGCSSPERRQWDSTSATATLLLTACMTDIVFDKLGHVTICMGKMKFPVVKQISLNKL
jgi:hypothetical protein